MYESWENGSLYEGGYEDESSSIESGYEYESSCEKGSLNEGQIENGPDQAELANKTTKPSASSSSAAQPAANASSSSAVQPAALRDVEPSAAEAASGASEPASSSRDQRRVSEPPLPKPRCCVCHEIVWDHSVTIWDDEWDHIECPECGRPRHYFGCTAGAIGEPKPRCSFWGQR